MDGRIPITDEMLAEMYELRMFVLLEIKPGIFRQLRLTKEQFKRISFAIMSEFRHGKMQDGKMLVDLILNDAEIKSDDLDKLQSSY